MATASPYVGKIRVHFVDPEDGSIWHSEEKIHGMNKEDAMENAKAMFPHAYHIEHIEHQSMHKSQKEAMVNIVRATKQLEQGNLAKAEELLNFAKDFTHELAKSEAHINEKLTGFISEVESILKKAKKLPKDFFKNDLRDTKKMQVNHTPGFKPNKTYKLFHELAPEDQYRALKTYGEKEMHQHQYPVDESGKFAGGQRAKLAEKTTGTPEPEASVPSLKNLEPQHREGAHVLVPYEGDTVHGISEGLSHIPNKVRVRVFDKKTKIPTSIHLDYHEVKMAKPSGPVMKSEIILNKSRETLIKLKNRKKS